MAITPSQFDAHNLGTLMTPGIRAAVFAEMENLLRTEANALITAAVDKAVSLLLMKLQSMEQFENRTLQLHFEIDGMALAVDSLPHTWKAVQNGKKR